MNLNAFDIIGVAAYFVLTGVFAYLVRRTRSFSEFSVGNRRIPAAMVFASMAATYIGPGFSVGFTAKGFSSGYMFYILSLTYPLQTILVAYFFAPRLSRFRDCHTIGDIMRKKYGKAAHLLAGIISVGLCIGFTAVMGKIGGELLRSLTGWSLGLSITVVTMSTALFTFTGGVRAVIATDAMHFSWVSIVVPIVLLVAFFKYPGTPAELSQEGMTLTQAGFSQLTGLQIAGIMVAFLVGETLIPPYANRALAARTEGASKNGFLLAGLYCIMWLAIVATMGVVAHKFVPADTAPDDVFLVLGHRMLPYGTYGLLLGAVIAIVMSSQESVLNSASVAFVRDIVGVRRQLSDKHALATSRVATLVIAASAAVAARYSPSIIEGLLVCYSIWAPGLLLPFLLGLYVKRTRPMAGWLSMLSGGTTAVVWQLLKEPHGYPAILVGLVVSAAAYAVGHLLGRQRALSSQPSTEMV